MYVGWNCNWCISEHEHLQFNRLEFTVMGSNSRYFCLRLLTDLMTTLDDGASLATESMSRLAEFRSGPGTNGGLMDTLGSSSFRPLLLSSCWLVQPWMHYKNWPPISGHSRYCSKTQNQTHEIPLKLTLLLLDGSDLNSKIQLIHFVKPLTDCESLFILH